MLQNRATLQKARIYLLQELGRIYPKAESASIARIILEHLGYPLSACIGYPDQVPGPVIVAQINEFVSEIPTGKPIQYILGHTYFCDLQISVNENVLIPRPETEELVSKITNYCILPPGRILDIGTGSGCIALALKNEYPDAEVSGIDLSGKALKVASENGRKNGLEVNWIPGDILNETQWMDVADFDIIVSNPPYVRTSEKAEMNANVLDFEPSGALFVPDDDPLIFYRMIASFGLEKLSETGVLWVEINEALGTETARLFTNAGFGQVTILKDIHEKERFIRTEK